MITGTAGAISLSLTLAPARIPATAGATTAMAPMVAIHPPSTDIQEVAGRTTAFTINPPVTNVRGAVACKTLASPSLGNRLGERCLRADRLRERFGEIGLFPRQVGSSEMTVGSGRPIDGPTQSEPLDDRAGTEVEKLLRD